MLLYISLPLYLWYLAMANHSQIHYYFTYRAQMITMFSLLAFLSFISSELLPVNGNSLSIIEEGIEDSSM